MPPKISTKDKSCGGVRAMFGNISKRGLSWDSEEEAGKVSTGSATPKETT